MTRRAKLTIIYWIIIPNEVTIFCLRIVSISSIVISITICSMTVRFIRIRSFPTTSLCTNTNGFLWVISVLRIYWWSGKSTWPILVSQDSRSTSSSSTFRANFFLTIYLGCLWSIIVVIGSRLASRIIDSLNSSLKVIIWLLLVV